jgi:hypothetical protein
MSEYHYYEFQALDRPLTQREMRARGDLAAVAGAADRLCLHHHRPSVI